MTNKHILYTDAERAEFENWLDKCWSREGRCDEEGDFVYYDDWVQGAFVGWTAARRAPAVPVPQSIEQMAVDRYKVVPSHESMFHRWAVVAGNGTQQLYIGREVECQNMALKFAGAFLDGAFVAMQNTAPAEGVPAQSYVADFFREKGFYPSLAQAFAAGVALAATQPAAQGMEQDAARYRYLRETDRYFSDDKDGAIYVRQIGITSGVITGSTILTDEELDAAIDAALAAQVKQLDS